MYTVSKQDKETKLLKNKTPIMRKLILIAVLFIAKTSLAQVIKDVSAGLIVSNVASTTFSGGSQPFEFG